MYSIRVYIPASHVEDVKQALFNAGAGKLGDYEKCCWQTLGEGQFLPLTNSTPFIGTSGKLEKVAEYLVEIICKKEYIQQAIAAIRASHPYQTPAYYITKIEEL